MPVVDILLVTAAVFCVDPFTDFYLAVVWFRTLVNLKNVLERMILVKSSQRKDPTDTRADGVDAASLILVKEYACFIISAHLKIGKDNSIYNIQL